MNRIILLIVFVLLSGCATIFSDTYDRVEFKSVPNGAKVEINGASVGRTPITVNLKREVHVPMVQMKLEGHESQQVLMQNSLNKTALWNILFWPGFVVDAVTGTLMKYEVLSYEAKLEAERKL